MNISNHGSNRTEGVRGIESTHVFILYTLCRLGTQFCEKHYSGKILLKNVFIIYTNMC